MDFLGNIVKNAGWGYWLTLFFVFGAGFLLCVFVPIKEFRGERSSGGGSASYTFRRALQFGKIFFLTLSGLCLLGFIGSITGLWRNRGPANFFGAFSALLILLLVVPIYRLTRNYLKGSEGEGKVEIELNKLPQDYFVFHDLPTGRGNIDHVIIGPTGVFIVETKNWKGKPWMKEGVLHLGKYPCPQLSKQAFSCAMFLNEYLKRCGLSVYVTAVLCLVQREARSFKARAGHVEIVGLNGLTELVSLGKPVLSPAQVEKVREALIALKSQGEKKGKKRLNAPKSTNNSQRFLNF